MTSEEKRVRRFLTTLIIPILIVAALNWRVVLTVIRSLLPRPAVTAEAVQQAADTQPDNSLLIPVLGLAAPIVGSQTDPTDVTDWSIIRRDLTNGVSLSERRPLPGQKGTTIILGHSSDWTPHAYSAIFAGLNGLKMGDSVLVKYHGQSYRYRIVGKEVVSPQTSQYFKETLGQTTDQNQLALITCWPLFTTAQRLVVIAELVPSAPIVLY
jgi:LPXTG-site transpeptidase (sortase) family protein